MSLSFCSLGKTLYAVFNALNDDLACYKYIEGNLSIKICRKGPTISALEADWLEMTTFYYKQGFSLIDSFVHWETLRGKSFFFYFLIFYVYNLFVKPLKCNSVQIWAIKYL